MARMRVGQQHDARRDFRYDHKGTKSASPARRGETITHFVYAPKLSVRKAGLHSRITTSGPDFVFNLDQASKRAPKAVAVNHIGKIWSGIVGIYHA
jgi:hypothetical protein